MVHRSINADGQVCDFCWDGAPIAQSNIRLTSGDYEVTIPFTPPPRRGSEFPGELKYTLKDSFGSNREWLTYAVDFPTDVLSLKITLPNGKPCLKADARVAIGGHQVELDGIQVSPNRQVITLNVKRPKLGTKIVTYWDW